MAPRANWKGFLRLSLVTCPVALYAATSDSERSASTRSIGRPGHRIKYAKVDADTGEEVSNDEIMKGYTVDTDTYIEVSKDELENIALEPLSTRLTDSRANEALRRMERSSGLLECARSASRHLREKTPMPQLVPVLGPFP